MAKLNPEEIPSRFAASSPLIPSPDEFPPRWVYRTIFYQIFPDRFANGDPENDPPRTAPWGTRPTRDNFFGGDLKGIIDRLDYLTELGVGGIYLNPIFLSPSNHKYDTQDYLLIDPHLGSLKTFGALLDAAHGRGIRVIIDGVFNHTGDRFWAFQHVLREGARSPYAGWYFCHDFPLRQHPKPNYECWWGFPSLPKLNVAHPEVLAYLTRVIEFWTTFGIDGWRLDVPNEVPFFFWRYFRRLVREINPEAYLVGEIWDDGRPWLQGDTFDAVMNYPWRDLVVKFFATGEMDLPRFVEGLAALRARYPEEVTLGLFNLLGSHDTPRFLTLAGGDKRRLKLAALFQFTYPGVPVIYYGDEVGLTGGEDPDCRKTMPWNPEEQDQDLLAFYRKLGAIRKHSPALWDGTFIPFYQDNAAGVWAYLREAGEERLLMVMNASQHDRIIALPAEAREEGRWEDLLRGGVYEVGPGYDLVVKLPALTGTVLRQG
ncbi:MAG: alpha-glycosidase [Firmicutes bacterium]|nr:alpha-glycosidase [Bacillota bacterium]